MTSHSASHSKPFLLCLLALLVGAAVPAAAFAQVEAAAADPAPVATLRAGQHVFWTAPHIESVEVTPTIYLDSAARGPVADALCEPGVSCFDYALDIVAPGRLRVAADSPWEGGTEMDLAVTAPDGTRATSVWIYDGTIPPRSQEVFVDARESGRYLVRLYVFYAEDVQIALRAKLEHVAPPQPVRPELPDLRAEPPGGFTWTTLGGVNCFPDEAAEGAQLCLRFVFGWQNVGRGMLDLVFDRTAPDATHLEGPVVQRLHASDGSYSDLPGAGSYQHHATHSHFHYKEFFSGELLRVTDRDAGTLESVAPVRKIGACSHDWKIAEWTRFVQAPQGNDSGGQCGTLGLGLPTQARIAVSAGWLDFYSAANNGNYVDFGDNGDGDYVVRIVMDPEHRLLEEDETNNLGYALVRIEGERITLLERGRGSDPWDADKVVLPLTL